MNTFQDVTFELSANPDVFMGDDVEITLKATNTSEHTRTLSGRLSLSTMYYTGVHYKNVDFLSVEEKPIEKGQGKFISQCTISHKHRFVIYKTM